MRLEKNFIWLLTLSKNILQIHLPVGKPQSVKLNLNQTKIKFPPL